VGGYGAGVAGSRVKRAFRYRFYPTPAQAAELQGVWRGNWDDLGKRDETAVGRIDDAIKKLRDTTLGTLRSLR